MNPVLFSVEHLSKRYGDSTVVDDLSFQIAAGECLGVIGPNGAGKTTFINMLSGRFAPSSGQILLAGEDVTALGQVARVKRGLARTFQISMLFKNATVVDNVAFAVAERAGVAWRMLRPARAYREVVDESMALLETLGLTQDARLRVAELSYGKQRLVEIAIALGLRPRVLLLDEPAAGVPTSESQRILEVLDALPEEIAILIIEHDMDLVFRFATRITVLAQGKVLIAGTPAEIAADKEVHEIYLGERHA